MKKRFCIFIALIFTTLGFVSCFEKQDETVISREFQGEIWNRFDYLEALFSVVKAPITADLVMDLEVSDVFPNIYQYGDEEGVFEILMSIDSPDGSSRTRNYKFRLKDKDGNFKSENKDGYYHFELPLISGISFNEKGEYAFMIESKYSKNPLYGVKSLRIKCINVKGK